MSVPDLPAGAVNLDGLKAKNRFQEERIKTLFLNQQGLRCLCGRNITTEGVELFLYNDRTMVPTEQGPQLGVKLEALRFCHRDCGQLQPAIQAAKDNDMQAIAIRKLPEVEWLNG